MMIIVIGGLTAIREKLLLGKNIHIKYVSCGREGCACRFGQRHGPYYYRRERTESGKYKDVYVRSTTPLLDFDYTTVGKDDVLVEIGSIRELPEVFEGCPVFSVKTRFPHGKESEA
jgi:hypothetical protein